MNCVLLLMCWCDIRAAERSSTKPFIWAGKCVRVSDRQQVPGVPGQRCGLSYTPTPSPSRSRPPPLSNYLSFSLLPSFTELYSHSIKFKQRHAGLFIGKWCFFISRCLFVALWSTEGFLAADVSSAALQRDGENVGEKGGKRKTERKRPNDKGRDKTRVGQNWGLHDIWLLVEHLHEASQGTWEGLFLSAICECKMSAHGVCVPVSLSSSLSDIIAGCMGKTEWLG